MGMIKEGSHVPFTERKDWYVLILRFVQIIGMLLVIEGLYLGIIKHSMNLEMIFVGAGVSVFYGSRWLGKKRD